MSGFLSAAGASERRLGLTSSVLRRLVGCGQQALDQRNDDPQHAATTGNLADDRADGEATAGPTDSRVKARRIGWSRVREGQQLAAKPELILASEQHNARPGAKRDVASVKKDTPPAGVADTT